MKLLLTLLSLPLLSCSHIPKVERIDEIPDLIPTENIIFQTTDRIKEKDHIPFVVEVPKNSIYKYELRTSTGALINDRELCQREIFSNGEAPNEGPKSVIKEFPISYGISPGRFNLDGDPLDVVVIGQEETYQDMVSQLQLSSREVRVIGLMKMEECELIPCKNDRDWLQDWKVIAVDLEAPESAQIQDVKDLPPELAEKLIEYWSNYKGQKEFKDKKYSTTRVSSLANKKEALRFISQFKAMGHLARANEIKKCEKIFDLFHKGKVPDSFRMKNRLKDFISCDQRVWPRVFYKNQESLERYFKLAAWGYLTHVLKDKSATFDNALERMKSRRENNEKHYRYVSFDHPSPGTGSAIFQWVKTTPQLTGCMDEVHQHYQDNPLIDFPEGLGPNLGENEPE